MKNLLIVILIAFLFGCSSKYTSIKDARNQEPMRTEIVDIHFDDAYANLSAAVTECFVIDIYKIHSVKRRTSGEIAVLSAQVISGANVWLLVTLEPNESNKTELKINWGNEFWRRHSDSVPSWAKGATPNC